MGVKINLPAAAQLSQAAKLGSLLVLLLLVLLLPAFLRVAYGYLLFNGIVLALGIQASLLRGGSTAASSSPNPDDDEDRHQSSGPGQAVAPTGVAPTGVAASPFQRARILDHVTAVADDLVVVPAFVATNIIELKTKTKEVVLKVLKKCPSTASIFFLSALNGSQAGGGEEKACQGQEEQEEDCDVDVDGDVRMSRQELFANAERFIGNFRKELRMQRQ